MVTVLALVVAFTLIIFILLIARRALPIWMIFAFLSGLAWPISPLIIILIFILASPVLLPSIYARYFALQGDVKKAYFFSSIAYVASYRDVQAAALAYGVDATLASSSDLEQTKNHLLWLKQRCYTHSKQLESGEMVMVVIIETLLEIIANSRANNTIEPQNAAKFTHARLTLLAGIKKDAIPAKVSVLAVKMALAYPLAIGDWNLIVKVAKQWDTNAENSIAKYLLECYRYRITGDKSTPISVVRRLRQKIKSIEPLYNLPVYLLEQNTASSNTNDLIRENKNSSAAHQQYLWQYELGNTKFSHDELSELTNKKVSITQINHWQHRASELGLTDENAVSSMLNTSVDTYVSLHQSTPGSTSDASYEDNEQRHKTLLFSSQSIDNKLSDKRSFNRVDLFLEWWRIWSMFNEFEKDDSNYCAAFSTVADMVDSLLIDIWNNRSQPYLLWLICHSCGPVAEQCGYEELAERCRDLAHRAYH